MTYRSNRCRSLSVQNLETRRVLDAHFCVAPTGADLQNQDQPCDVNADGLVTEADAEAVIEFLALEDPEPANGPPFLDVNGDAIITALDAAIVIAFLDSNPEPGIPELRNQTEDLDLDSGELQRLTAKLDSAEKLLNGGKGNANAVAAILNAYGNEVETLSEKGKISDADRDEILATLDSLLLGLEQS